MGGTSKAISFWIRKQRELQYYCSGRSTLQLPTQACLHLLLEYLRRHGTALRQDIASRRPDPNPITQRPQSIWIDRIFKTRPEG